MRCCWLLIVLAACRHHAPVVARGDGPRIAVLVRDPGADAEQMERSIVVPIERALADMRGVVHVSARIAPGSARIELELGRDADSMGATEELRKRLPLRELPSTIEPPAILNEQAPEPVLHFVLRSDRLTAVELRALAEQRLAAALERVPGIADVETCGGARRQLLVEPDPQALAAAGVTMRDVRLAASLPQLDARAAGRDQLARTVVAQRNGAPVYLGDIARVVDDAAPPKCRAYDERGAVVTGTARGLAGVDETELHEGLARALAAERAKLTADTILELAPRGAAFEVDAPSAEQVRDALAKVPGAERVLVEQGAEPLASLEPDRARVFVEPRDAVPAAIAALRARGLIVHDRDEVVVQLSGPDRTQLIALAKSAAAALAATPGIVSSGDVGMTTRAALEIVPDPAKLAALGVDARQLAEVIRSVSDDGIELGMTGIGAEAVPIVLRVGGGREQLLHLTIGGVPLDAVARLEQRSGVTELRREDREPWVGVAASGNADAIDGAMAHVAMPAGYRWRLVAGRVAR